jgi:peptidoglycan/LPS O-acetylase OafA/YrhL
MGTVRRYTFIDAIRGLAACLVMLEHALEAGGFLKIERGAFGLSWFNIGEMGVVAFFFVSGFVIPMSLERWNNIPHFWINRVLRIYPLYVCVYLAAIAVVAGGSLTWRGLPLNIAVHTLFIQEFFNTPNFVQVAWTLSLEAVWYVGFTILFILGLHRRIGWLVVLCLLFSLTACLVTAFGLRLPMGRLCLLLVCVLGLFCVRREFGEIGHRVFAIAFTAVAGAVAVNLVVGFLLYPSPAATTPSFRCVAISWVLGMAIFLIPFLFRGLPMIHGRVLIWLGKVSYSIYLVHVLAIMGLEQTSLEGSSLVFAILAVTLALSGLTYRWIEQPMIAYAHALRPVKTALG